MVNVIKPDESKRDIQRVSRADEIDANDISLFCTLKKGEKRISVDGDLDIGEACRSYWNAYRPASAEIRKWHLTMAQYYATLRDACEPTEPAHGEYSEKRASYATLLKYLHGNPEITFAREQPEIIGVRTGQGREGFEWLYPFENSLIAIKPDVLLEGTAILSLSSQLDRFTAYSLSNGRVFAADNTCKIYDWDPFSKRLGPVQQLPDTCKEVTAMQGIGNRDVAILFKDNNNNKKAGFLVNNNGNDYVFSIVPSAKQISGITWMYDGELNVCGSILYRESHLYTMVAKYIIHHQWAYPNNISHVEYIVPNPDALQGEQKYGFFPPCDPRAFNALRSHEDLKD